MLKATQLTQVARLCKLMDSEYFTVNMVHTQTHTYTHMVQMHDREPLICILNILLYKIMLFETQQQ